MKNCLSFIVLLLPWAIKRPLLIRIWGYALHPTARIAFAWVFPESLTMEAHSRIGNLTICKGLHHLCLEDHASIGRANWITGFPRGPSRHFGHQTERSPGLHLERHAAITSRHIIDCTAQVTVGHHATVAGFRSQILTHSIDLENNRQSSSPVRIGAYSFVGTGCVVLGGSVLPDYAVLGAKSLLNKAHTESYRLYAGVPARDVKALPKWWGYFHRQEGFVY